MVTFTIDPHQTVIQNQNLARIEIIIAKTVIMLGINQPIQNQTTQSQVINLIKIVTITDQATIKVAGIEIEINVEMSRQ